ncbi:MAG: IS4 family transposase [Chloroflexi bacterium]|nr:IS4 family transposase [Chloroflexota bacterium]
MIAELPAGPRITDYISLGVLAGAVPRTTVDEVLKETGKGSERERELPAHVMVYYAMALSLYARASYCEVLRCLLEGLQWLADAGKSLPVTGKSGISQARSRLGSEPLRKLYERVVRPIATAQTRGAWYRQWRVVSLDGSTLATADTSDNEQAFGRPGESRGKAAYPLLRFVGLVENGTHVLFGADLEAYHVGETTIARRVIQGLRAGMLCLADRNFFSFDLWQAAQANGADLLWRIKHNLVLPRLTRLPDGSYLSKIYPSAKDRRDDTTGVWVRVVDYRLEGVEDAEPIYRLVTTIRDPQQAPAHELAALYHERWEIETALDELKTHLRASQITLRSKKPDLVRQEFWGLLLTHFAIRGIMHEAALKASEDPDTLSFMHAVRVVRRKLPAFVAAPPGDEGSDASVHTG